MANLARRRLIGGVLTGVCGLALTGTTAFAALPTDTLSLPRPTGPHPVGAETVYLKDTSRADPWVPTQDFRELMVTVWYPTRDRHGYTQPRPTHARRRVVTVTSVIDCGPRAESKALDMIESRPAVRSSSGVTG